VTSGRPPAMTPAAEAPTAAVAGRPHPEPMRFVREEWRDFVAEWLGAEGGAAWHELLALVLR
jgi:hypothetical protein